MQKYYKIIDNQSPVVQNYLPLVFFRGERVKDRVSWFRWLWFCLLEIIFGQELLESFVTTASNSGCPEDDDDESKYGEPNQLNLHIPSGYFTNKLRAHLVQVLYYKYYRQYLFIQPVGEPLIDKKTNTIDVTSIRFRFNKDLLYLVIPFRRIYIASEFVLNVIFDLIVYFATENLSLAIIVGVILEIIRRVLKI